MKNLAVYVERKNAWAKIFGDAVYNVKNLDQRAAQELYDQLECDLSPENLTCDGELDAVTVRERRTLYQNAQRELKAAFHIKETAY